MLALMSSVSTIRPRSAEVRFVYRCPDCGRRGTLQLVRHPAGDVLVCRRCLGAHHQAAAAPSSTDDVRTSRRQRLGE
jgi:ribosomal protein L37AE/L43A